MLGSVDALETGFRAATKWFFAGVNLDTLKKKETNRNTEDAVGHQPWYQSWTGSTAALPTAGFWAKKDSEERHVQLISTVLPCINISYYVSNLKGFS